MDKKTTQKEYLTAIIAVLNGEEQSIPTAELVEFCEGRIEQLAKKSANKKPTKTQLANEELKETILDILKEEDNPISVSAILLDSRIEVGTSCQKVSAVLKSMAETDKTVIRHVDKKSVTFSAA